MNRKIYKIFIVTTILIIILFNSNNVYADDGLSINAKSSLIVEVNSGKIIYEDNANMQNYPASITKILTAIIVLENCELNDMATVSKSAISNIPIEYVVTPVYVGEKISIEDLLYALMLKSANDAAYVLAEHVAGSVEAFSDMMNKKAEELGCKNSHFVNPNGIHDDNHYTTAYDMYLIAKYAMKNEIFAKIVSTYQYTLSATNKYSNKDRVMENTNFFINPNSKYYNKSVNGIKTGTTSQAGNCLITDIRKNGIDIITIIVGAKTKERRFSETNKMIDYSFSNYTNTKLHEKGDIIKTVEVKKAKNKNLNLVISDEINVIKNVKIKTEDIEPEILLSENIIAPISAGQEIGTIKYNVDGLEYSAKLLAADNIERKVYYKEIMIVGGIIILFVIIKRKSKKHKRLRTYKKNKYKTK